MMKIVNVGYNYEEGLANEEELLELHYTTVGWAEALQKCGLEVTVVQRFNKESSIKKNGVQYYFIKDKLKEKLRTWQIPWKLLRQVASSEPDIVHLHELSLPLQTLILRGILKKKTAIVIQHHGGPIPKGIKKSLKDLLNSIADGFFFTTKRQGELWFRNRKMSQNVYPIMEGSTFFNYEKRDADIIVSYQDRKEARKLTSLNGEPAFLWVGRLDNNKDPITVLDGFEMIFQRFPSAKLFMIYSDDKLVNDVKNKIENSYILKSGVLLLGKIPHEEITNYYNSADYFVLGSHYEGSGYALSEALRCGCVPIITNIPSFTMITDNGQLGALWEPGNKTSFVEAAIRAMSKPQIEEGKACIEFYKNKLSFSAIAEQAIKHYNEIINKRRK